MGNLANFIDDAIEFGDAFNKVFGPDAERAEVITITTAREALQYIADSLDEIRDDIADEATPQVLATKAAAAADLLHLFISEQYTCCDNHNKKN
jgi:hypothetical protein